MNRMDLDELVGFLGTHFEKIDQRFDRMDKRFDGIEIRLDKLELRVGILETNVANLAGEVHSLTQEMRISNHRHERMENWAESAGKAIGVPFVR